MVWNKCYYIFFFALYQNVMWSFLDSQIEQTTPAWINFKTRYDQITTLLKDSISSFNSTALFSPSTFWHHSFNNSNSHAAFVRFILSAKIFNVHICLTYMHTMFCCIIVCLNTRLIICCLGGCRFWQSGETSSVWGSLSCEMLSAWR